VFFHINLFSKLRIIPETCPIPTNKVNCWFIYTNHEYSIVMKSPIAIFLSLLVVLSNINTSCFAAGLENTERELVRQVYEGERDALKLLKKTVNINSGTMNFSGVKKVGSVFSKELKKLGFEVTWIKGKSFGRAGHLLATHDKYEKSNVKKLLMIGHLDTVFAKSSDFDSYKVIDEQRVAGPGITDMKGGNVIMILALKALKESGQLERMRIKIIMTGDEEKRGSPYEVATKELIEAGKWADIALGFEDGDGNPKTAVVSRRGSTGWQLKVTGRPAHSSQIFRQGYGDGAIFEAARILNQFREQLSTQPNLTFNPGVILGGTDVDFDSGQAKGNAFGKSNVIAQSAIISGDIRALSPEQLSNAQAAMQKIVSNNLAETSATLEFFPGYPPMAPSEGNKRLLEIYNQASQDLGFGEVQAVDPRKAGAADISFVANHVDMALDGLGLMGAGGHTVNEVADITTLVSQAQRAVVVMYRLSKE